MSATLSCPWPNTLCPTEILRLTADLAERVGRRFPPHVAQRLSQEAPSHVALRIARFRPERAKFQTWAFRVLLNLGRDLYRRSRGPARFLSPAALVALPRRTANRLAPPNALNELAAHFRVVREVLNEISWHPVEGRPDLFAVLLLRLRLGLAARVGTALGEGALLFDASVGQFVTGSLPWTATEEGRACCAGLLPLGTVWSTLATHFCQSPYRATAEQVCRAVRGEGPGQPPVERARWATWSFRARTTARQSMEEATWQRYFAPWASGRESGSREAALESGPDA